MRPLLWVCLAALSVTLTSPTWSQQKPARIALVIGNAAYPSARTPLATTIADARSLADELRRSGFEVDLKTNVGKADMRNAIDGFTNRIGAGVDALFYFSGYGMQADRQSYLMPVNADAWSPSDIRKDGIRIDSVLAEMHRKGARVKILIIDGRAVAVHPDDLPRLEAAWRAHLPTEQAFEIEQRLRRADGEYRWFLFRRVPLRDENGEVIRWYAAAHDIEDQKRAEYALQRSET